MSQPSLTGGTRAPIDVGATPTIRVFGGTGLDDAGVPISIGGPRQHRLLALLSVRADTVVSVDWLAEYLWNDDDRPDATARAIRTYLSRLRAALPDAARDWIETEQSGYRLSAPPDALEHRRFARLRADATLARERQDPQNALRLLDEALALWRGEPFRELEDLDWARTDVEQLRLDRLEMLEERWEAALALGRHTQITGELAAFTSEHRLRDRAACQYALALHRSGRTTEALRVLADHRRHLAEESGLDPSPRVAELESAMLAGDRALDVEKVGRPLRGYRLLEQIGSGAFSIVWSGMQPSVDREVAIKQIRPELACQPEFIRRFEIEARLVARIEHPHIVPLIDYWRDPDSAYLVMRRLRGGTLERRLDSGPLAVEDVERLARQIGDALATAHAQGVVHRDVKSANILFDEQDNAFLSDFGIALEAAATSGSEAALSPGSPAYASPEQIRQEQLGPEADVFSLGVVLFECLAGTLPFPSSSSVRELVELQLATPYPSLSDIRAEVPPAMVAAVARATSKDPAERFATVADFIESFTPVRVPDVRAPEVRAPSARVADLTNPYNGLRAFDGGDADRFFGREALVAELVGRLAGEGVESRCVVVVGPSGSGKSSVVRAGVVPALRAGAVAGSSKWFTTTMLPGTDPYESLEAALLRIAVNPPPSLLDQLRDGPRGVLRSVRRCLSSDGDRLLLAIDQLEELFIDDADGRADDFLEALSVAVEDPASPLRVVATLRADYYHHPLAHPTFARILKDAAVDVAPLAPNELEDAIVEPARRIGVGFEPGLVARISAETIGQPAPLPLLQYMLSELFEAREGDVLTIAAYDSLGGLGGALAARADGLYASADADERAAVRRAFGRLTNPGEQTADLRRRVPIVDLGTGDPGTGDATSWVLAHFGSARLLTFDRDVATREPTVEVAHEALLREWPRLVGWLEEDLVLLRASDAIAAAATAWDEADRPDSDLCRGGRLDVAADLLMTDPDRLRPLDREFIDASRAATTAELQTEQRRVRRLRGLVVGVAAALVIALIAAGLALVQLRRADDEAERAGTAAAAAEEQAEAATQAAAAADVATMVSRSAALDREEPEVALLLALEAHRRAPGPDTEQGLLTALGRTPLGGRVAAFERYPASGVSGGAGWLSRDGMWLSPVADGMMVRRSLVDDSRVEIGPAPEDSVGWIGDESVSRRVAYSLDETRWWFGPLDGDWEREIDFDVGMYPVTGRTLAANRLVIATQPGRYDGEGGWILKGEPLSDVQLVDGTTGEPVGPAIEGLVEPWAALSADDELIAVRSESSSTFTSGRAYVDVSSGLGGNSAVFVLDAATGEEQFRLEIASNVVGLAFGPDGDELYVGTQDGHLLTIDVEQQEVVADVETTATTQLLDVVPLDGRIVVVSAGLAEVVDPRTGPVEGTQIELDNAIAGSARVDGTLLVTDTGADMAVYDLDATALAARIVDIEPGTDVVGGTGEAAVLDRRGAFERLDLASGERSPIGSVAPSGDVFEPLQLWPDSILSVAPRVHDIARWEDGDVIERVHPGAEEVFSAHPPDPAPLDRMAITGLRVDDGLYEVSLLNTTPGELEVLLTIETRGDPGSAPSPDGGLIIAQDNGTLQSYDSSGALVAEGEAGLFNLAIAVTDPSTGLVAFGGWFDGGVETGAIIVDPETLAVQEIPDIGLVANLTFLRDGEFLAVMSQDGTVRLWDVESARFVRDLWDGRGADPYAGLWYDETSDSLWFDGGGNRLVNISLAPEVWVERACQIVGRDFTQDEWDRFVPGDEPLASACG